METTPVTIGRRLVLVLAVLTLTMVGMTTSTAPAEAAGLTEDRRCRNFVTGDQQRRLSVCSRGWTGDGIIRGVVEMHTYARAAGGGPVGWIDAPSQSITLNEAEEANGTSRTYGNNYGGQCRVNGPGGRVACSVSGTHRVAFFGPALPFRSNLNENWVRAVSWRDDRGIPHWADPLHPTGPDSVPFYHPWLLSEQN